MSWLLVLFFLSFTVNNLVEASHDEKKDTSAVVVGTVYCDTCFQEDFSKSSHFISGASVAVECLDGKSWKPSFRQEVKTDEHGEFKINLPFSVSKHVKKIKRCSVKLIRSSEPYCAVASTATSTSLHLKSRKQGIHIFSAGFFTFKPLKQPNLCNQKPAIPTNNDNNQKDSLPPLEDPTFPPPLQDPTTPNLPPIGQNHLPPLPFLPRLPPLPQLPPLPTLPGLPSLPPLPGLHPPRTTKTTQLSESDQKVAHPKTFPFPTPAIPFLPPPIFPPNPLQPPSVIPPIIPPIIPPPAPLIPLPPIPGLTPPPPPPTIPNVPGLPPFPLPPFPFPPSPPRIPGIPPASSSPKKPSP